VVDLDSTCFPFPPAGSDLLAECEVWTRVFRFIVDGDGPSPGLEVVRAMTPYGGDWHFEADMTNLVNALQGPHLLEVYIGTLSSAGGGAGSKAGWNLTARLDLMKGEPRKKVLAAIPLFYADNYTSESGEPSTTFVVPQGTTEAFIEYRVTGHGIGEDTTGECFGGAEEFCQRLHTVFVDGNPIGQFTPWRAEGGPCTLIDYEGQNPAAPTQICCQNPTGVVFSVTVPRSNWAPGTVTPPIVVTSSELLAPGQHTFSYRIDHVAPGFGYWNVSATYFAFSETQ
jgi:peptide-N-glycosidase F-like protein